MAKYVPIPAAHSIAKGFPNLLTPKIRINRMYLPENSLASANIQIPGKILASCVSGSWLYGVSNHESDLDWKYVYVLPTKTLLGLYAPNESKLTREGKIEDMDGVGTLFEWVAHEVGKFCRLLLKGNPTMVEMVSHPDSSEVNPSVPADHESNVGINPLWYELCAKAPELLSRRTVGQYLGYINGQMQRLKKGMKLHTGNKGEYNTKWAYHMVRLAWDLLEIIEGKIPVVCHIDNRREHLIEIRQGFYTEDEILLMVNELVAKVEKRKPWDNLPEEGPKEWMNDWLLRARAQHGEIE